MPFDPSLPSKLQKVQEWFGQIISRPMVAGDQIQPEAPSGRLIKEEAADWILPSPTLAPYQRLEIYNQQYWWRLVGVLAKEFPMLVRLFGFDGFREGIATPFLDACPPNHWSLELLGQRLPDWLAKHYHEEDRALILDAAALDWAFSYHVVAGERAPLREKVELDVSLYLQPYVTPFSFAYDLIAFRDALLAEETDHWVDNPFPDLIQEKEHYDFVFYRTSENGHIWETIDPLAYAMLAHFSKGGSVGALCEYITESFSEDELISLPTHLQVWAAKGWLSLEPRISSFSS